MMRQHVLPADRARASVRDPQLVRPDWTVGRPRDPRLLWLDRNENTDPELVAVTQRVLAEVDQTAIYTYPECAPLYTKLGAYLGVAPDHLLLTAGSDGGIRSMFEAFVDPGDVVVHTLPTFAMYAVYARMYGARAVQLDYWPSDGGPSLTVDRFVTRIHESRPKMVCLPNPDSPTGTVFVPGELRQIIEAAGEVDAVILIDEAYHPFYQHTALPWVEQYPHLAIARTFAKAWGLAGLRVGYVVAQPALVSLLHKVRPMYEVNTLAVAAIERMLDHAADMEASVRRLLAGRDAFLSAMRGLGFRTLRTHGNFLHVGFGDHARAVHAALQDLVLYRRDFSEPCLQGFSRFSATTEAGFQPVIDRIRQTVSAERHEWPPTADPSRLR
jgi:histidinol-phosphate aminotransferase